MSARHPLPAGTGSIKTRHNGRGLSIRATGGAARFLAAAIAAAASQLPGRALTTVRFIDTGQDFLEWDLDHTGKVVACRPYQGDVWLGVVVLGTPVPGERPLVKSQVIKNAVKLLHTVESVQQVRM